MKQNKDKVEISISKLEEVAAFYEFPVAVFFTAENHLTKKKGTRNQLLIKAAETLDKIQDIIEDYRAELTEKY